MTVVLRVAPPPSCHDDVSSALARQTDYSFKIFRLPHVSILALFISLGYSSLDTGIQSSDENVAPEKVARVLHIVLAAPPAFVVCASC